MPDSPHTDCHCPSDAELDRLSDERLIAHFAEQRDAGRSACALAAMKRLAFGRWAHVCARVAAKVPPQDVDDVAQEVMASALASAFAGKSVGQFVNWLKVITHHRIADYWKDDERRPETEPLPEEHDSDEEIFGATPSVDGGYDAIHIREAAGRLLEELEEQNPIHAAVARLYGPGELGWADLPARRAAAEVERLHPGAGVSEANVHKIWSRFREDLHRELGLEGF